MPRLITIFKHSIIIILIVIVPQHRVWPADSLPVNIKILIGTYNKQFSMSGNRIKLTCLDSGRKPVYFAHHILTVKREIKGITINQEYFAGQHFRLASSGGTISLNNDNYGGAVIIECSGGKEMLLINEIDLEQYLAGLISIELSPRWELTAMKAQAVVARTYALYQKANNSNNPYHLTTSVLHQLYRGIEHATAKTRQAVKETRGEVLTYNGLPIMAVYHSCCGGRTEDAENVWSTDKNRPYLRSVFCGACTGYDKYFWKLTVPRGTFYQKLSQAGYPEYKDEESLGINRRSSTNRVLEISIQRRSGGKAIPCNDFRSLFGFSEMRSTNFIIRETEDGYLHFLGIGNGHGVGMCQWGVRFRALRGETYQNILRHYYPGTKLERGY